MAIERDEQAGGEAETAGHRADPVVSENQRVIQSGGPLSGDPGAGGEAYGSGGHKGRGPAGPSGSRMGSSDATPSNEVAPRVHTSMDEDVRATEEKAARSAAPQPRGA